MNKLEISKLLTVVSTYDNRKIATETVEAWFLVLGDISFEEASEAIVMHFKDSTNWLLPAHIRTNVRIIRDRKEREARIKRPRLEGPIPDYEFDRQEHEEMVRKLIKEREREIANT
jgi:hypothetical protein